MWLDGDPKLLAYFFLYEISGVLLVLLLISFGATKHVRRYAHPVTTPSVLTIIYFSATEPLVITPDADGLRHISSSTSPVLISMTVSWLLGAFPSASFL